jgi:hypothetical protein
VVAFCRSSGRCQLIVKQNAGGLESCSNCGEAIGRLETPMLWNEHIVCVICHTKLEAAKSHQAISTAPAEESPTGHHCPSCGSLNIKSLSVAYMSGTRDSKFLGISFSGGGDSVFGGGGLSQSLLAKRAAPPVKRSIGLATACIVIFSVAALGCAVSGISKMQSISPFDRGDAKGLFLFAAITSSVALLSLGYWNMANKFNRTEWPALHKRWSSSWICDKCGNVFS